MRASQQGFDGIVRDAFTGKLRLPEFQRNWVWKRSDVLRLFDSIRKAYPIGGFLVLEASNQINLSPRPFEGSSIAPESVLQSYVLDGQQRITAGLALYHGVGNSQYFLDLERMWDLCDAAELDFDDWDCLREFANDMDEGDGYLRARRASANPRALLESHHLLWTKTLANDLEFSDAKERYLELYPERQRFLERLVWPFFKIGADPIVPVTILDSDMPVEAITRVFETLNTSGQRLTPFEIVVAVLFARGIHLREEVEDYREMTNCYPAMDSTGEVFLQTIALMDGKNPKKTLLPKSITEINYMKFNTVAIADLDLAGEFLSREFGMGLDETNQLIPYDSMFAPLAIALAELERKFPDPSPDKAAWHRQLQRWFVGSILIQRYSHAQPTTQQNDSRELLDWINGNSLGPDWLDDVRVPALSQLTPTSAIGKLIACMISRERPRDPMNAVVVGGAGSAINAAQSHHIFPKAFCEQHIANWDPRSRLHNLALNVMPLTKETNRRWTKMNPSDQVADVINRTSLEETFRIYSQFLINERCLAIMRKSEKTVQDYNDFIRERGRTVQEYIHTHWGLELDEQHLAEDEDEA